MVRIVGGHGTIDPQKKPSPNQYANTTALQQYHCTSYLFYNGGVNGLIATTPGFFEQSDTRSALVDSVAGYVWNYLGDR